MRSPAAGVVRFAARVAGRGVVVVEHRDRSASTLEPVESTLRPGQEVGAGQGVGTLEPGGHCAPDWCLHWGLRRGGHYVDPTAGAATRVRLLPIPAELAMLGRRGGPGPS